MAVLSLKLESVTVRVAPASFARPPPWVAALPVKVMSARVRVPELSMPPPLLAATPSSIVISTADRRCHATGHGKHAEIPPPLTVTPGAVDRNALFVVLVERDGPCDSVNGPATPKTMVLGCGLIVCAGLALVLTLAQPTRCAACRRRSSRRRSKPGTTSWPRRRRCRRWFRR